MHESRGLQVETAQVRTPALGVAAGSGNPWIYSDNTGLGANRFLLGAACRRRRVSLDGRSAQDVPDHVGMAPFEQLAQHLWLLVPALIIWFGPAAGRRWLAFLRDLREFKAGR
jgi:hypothetical protein